MFPFVLSMRKLSFPFSGCLVRNDGLDSVLSKFVSAIRTNTLLVNEFDEALLSRHIVHLPW